jgi:hypothetical protein
LFEKKLPFWILSKKTNDMSVDNSSVYSSVHPNRLGVGYCIDLWVLAGVFGKRGEGRQKKITDRASDVTLSSSSLQIMRFGSSSNETSCRRLFYH